jgi:hypothetical protein
MAVSDDLAEEQRFYRQIAANGLTNGTPKWNTPLSKWVEETDITGLSAQKKRIRPEHPPPSGPRTLTG